MSCYLHSKLLHIRWPNMVIDLFPIIITIVIYRNGSKCSDQPKRETFDLNRVVPNAIIPSKQEIKA